MPATTSRLGRVSTWLGRLCLVTVFLGPALAHFFIAAPIAGFGVFLLGVLFGVLAVIVGLLALIVGPAGSRGATLAGIVVALLVVVAVLVMSGARSDIPRINDITTDTENPPQFVHAGTLPENAGRDMAYPGATFAEQQKAGYADLGPVTPGDAAGRGLQAGRRGRAQHADVGDHARGCVGARARRLRHHLAVPLPRRLRHRGAPDSRTARASCRCAPSRATARATSAPTRRASRRSSSGLNS